MRWCIALFLLVSPALASASDCHAAGSHVPALVADYRAGDPAAAPALADCFGILREFLKLAPVPPGQSSAARERFAAVMLLTDAGREAWQRHDDRWVNFFDLASRVLQSGGEAMAPFVETWHATAARWMRSNFDVGAAERFLDKARERFPNQPAIVYESGVTAEILAVAYDKEPPNPPATTAGSVVPRYPHGSAAAERRKAASFFTAALALRVGWPATTKVRLAHVLLLDGDHDTARALADDVAAAPPPDDPALGYIAGLIGGAASEAAGDLDGAVARYRAAMGNAPGAPFAATALAEALVRSGHAADARAVLEAHLSLTTMPPEPWWVLMLDVTESVDNDLAHLRTEARRH